VYFCHFSSLLIFVSWNVLISLQFFFFDVVEMLEKGQKAECPREAIEEYPREVIGEIIQE